MPPKKIAVIATRDISGVKGGAERFYVGLCNALNNEGAKADLIEIISNESCFDSILESYLRFYDLDLHQYDGVISTKAPGYMIRHPNHITYLQHTMRVFYDMFESEFKHKTNALYEQRKLIQFIDSKALEYPRIRKIFVIGFEVQKRLKEFNGLDSEVLYQALSYDAFIPGRYENYILMPGRLHRWKRVDLVVKAIIKSRSPVVLKIIGTGEDEAYFKKVANNDKRVQFYGRVSDQELIDLYSNALAVAFTPVREDFGLITLEAFKSRKPVITCSDSGEPAHIVQDGVSGFICPPNAKKIAQKIDYLFNNADFAEKMGENGYNRIKDISWAHTAKTLIKALE